MTKDERVEQYLDLASEPEMLPRDTGSYMVQLDITDADIEAYRQKKELALSFRPAEKRNIVVKQVIKPLLKKHGFSVSGLDWHRETKDGYLIIHMMNSSYNSIASGASFRFHISAAKKEEIADKLSNQWAYNQTCDLNQFAFLPYCGMLSPIYAGTMYQIDGYKNYLPSDTPIENICRQIEEDFGTYILPKLCPVNSYEDFAALRAAKLKRYDEKEIRLLQYYYAAQSSAMEYSGSGFLHLVHLRKELELNPEDIASHLEWLDIVRNNFPFTKVDAKEIAVKAAQESGVCNG